MLEVGEVWPPDDRERMRMDKCLPGLRNLAYIVLINSKVIRAMHWRLLSALQVQTSRAGTTNLRATGAIYLSLRACLSALSRPCPPQLRQELERGQPWPAMTQPPRQLRE